MLKIGKFTDKQTYQEPKEYFVGIVDTNRDPWHLVPQCGEPRSKRRIKFYSQLASQEISLFGEYK